MGRQVVPGSLMTRGEVIAESQDVILGLIRDSFNIEEFDVTDVPSPMTNEYQIARQIRREYATLEFRYGHTTPFDDKHDYSDLRITRETKERTPEEKVSQAEARLAKAQEIAKKAAEAAEATDSTDDDSEESDSQ